MSLTHIARGALPPHCLIQCPTGVWIFVGHVDARLHYPTTRTAVWNTAAKAIAAAAALGIEATR